MSSRQKELGQQLAMPRAFTTSSTGAPVRRAIWAVLPSWAEAPRPSNSPITPSIRAMSLAAA